MIEETIQLIVAESKPLLKDQPLQASTRDDGMLIRWCYVEAIKHLTPREFLVGSQ
jgi:hypothetical protein